jgi:hypothetical protein
MEIYGETSSWWIFRIDVSLLEGTRLLDTSRLSFALFWPILRALSDCFSASTQCLSITTSCFIVFWHRLFCCQTMVLWMYRLVEGGTLKLFSRCAWCAILFAYALFSSCFFPTKPHPIVHRFLPCHSLWDWLARKHQWSRGAGQKLQLGWQVNESAVALCDGQI